MLCYQCQESLSDYIDGAMELGEQAKIEHHIAECDACRAVRDDLLQIVHFSRNLPLHTPSSAVWTAVRSELGSSSRRPPARFYDWFAKGGGAQFRVGVATAVVLLLASVIALQFRSLSRGSEAGGQAAAASPQPIIGRGADSSSPGFQDMEHEINLLKASVEANSGGWNPEVRTAYNRDILHVDQSLARCQHELVDHPNNDVCREMMMNAYQEKVRLLEGFTDF
jgi:hypothetical protein